MLAEEYIGLVKIVKVINSSMTDIECAKRINVGGESHRIAQKDKI
jgi:hypothetical protein